jgi:hypothetical protein
MNGKLKMTEITIKINSKIKNDDFDTSLTIPDVLFYKEINYNDVDALGIYKETIKKCLEKEKIEEEKNSLKEILTYIENNPTHYNCVLLKPLILENWGFSEEEIDNIKSKIFGEEKVTPENLFERTLSEEEKRILKEDHLVKKLLYSSKLSLLTLVNSQLNISIEEFFLTPETIKPYYNIKTLQIQKTSGETFLFHFINNDIFKAFVSTNGKTIKTIY